MGRIAGFPPIWRSDARVLILGTMPSVKSLEQDFYYGHPRNAFWPIMAEVFQEESPQTKEEKARLLTGHHVALWDVCESCVRPGSLDSSIRDVVPNDIGGLYAECIDLHYVLFNGGAAEALYKRHIGALPEGITSLRLPSTSPAYTLSYTEKRDQWRRALEATLCLRSG